MHAPLPKNGGSKHGFSPSLPENQFNFHGSSTEWSTYFRVSFPAPLELGAAGAFKQVLKQLAGGLRYVSIK